MKLVIVGCGGFVGSHLLDRLLQNNSVPIVGWDPDVRKIDHHLDNPNLQVYRQSIHAPEAHDSLNDSVAWADAVINLAAICNPAEYNKNPLNVIRACGAHVSAGVPGRPVAASCRHSQTGQAAWGPHYRVCASGKTCARRKSDGHFD
jgi:nucleoside-diphosphate-sugar epimerase